MKTSLLYHTKEIFGLDVGRTTIKVAQVKHAHGNNIQVLGYGYGPFDKTAVKDGEILKPDLIAATINELVSKKLIGKIDTSRIAASIPVAHSYVRILNLPKMPEADLAEAVGLEAEQYVPVPNKDLYIEHHILEPFAPAQPKPKAVGANPTTAAPATLQILMLAVPKRIIDSYMKLYSLLGLEVDAIEPNMFANLRVAEYVCPSEKAKILIDFGAQSSDIAIYDNSVRLTSTVATGGDHITDMIGRALKLDTKQANQLKIHYGIGKSRWQAQLAEALQPILSNFANEVQKMMRYYAEHTENKSSIGQILVMGGGANMPGLADFLTHLTGVEVVVCNPWSKLIVKPLQPPSPSETTIYATAIGLALKELEK